MKLLITTQAVDLDDPVLGFFCRWIEEFAKHCERVEVICLKEGKHELPANVRVHSLGKERGEQSAFVYATRFKLLNWKLRHDYDAVFVHMNPEYVLLGAPLWRLAGKRVGLWYLHKSVTLKLRAAVHLASVVFTASPESMRVATGKKRVVGHGIDLAALAPASAPIKDEPLELLTIGRLSRVKRVEVLIDAVALLQERGIKARLSIVGAPATPEDEGYTRALAARSSDSIRFLGPVAHDALPQLFAAAHLFLHASATGSLDKAALEPLAAGLPIITTNRELTAVGIRAVIGADPTPESFAGAIERALHERLWADVKIREEARAYILREHSLATLIPRILRDLAPAPDPKAFYDGAMREKLGENYEHARWGSSALQRAQYAMTADTIQRLALPALARASTILEVGPGPGTWSKILLAGLPQAQLTLLDISREMLGEARAALDPARVTTLESDLMAFESGALFDGFFSSRAIEYFPDKSAAARKIAGLLAPGSSGMIITKMPKPLFDRLRGRTPSSFHSGQVAPRALLRALRASGLRVELVRPATATFPGLGSAALNRAVFALTRHVPPVFPFSIFAESYCVIFQKP